MSTLADPFIDAEMVAPPFDFSEQIVRSTGPVSQ